MGDGWDTQIQCQTCDALGRENAELKAEVERLKRELVDENHKGFIPRRELLQEVERLRGLADDLEGLVFDGGRNYDPEEAYRIVQAMLRRESDE